jgi:SAM-dependent methyltransferase
MTQNDKSKILNAGSGSRLSGKLPEVFVNEFWAETRLDIVPANEPDIVGSIADMRDVIDDGAFDVVYSSHAVEHLYAHEVIPAFRELRRVLKPGGFALVTCPNLISIARYILTEDVETIAYESPAGPVRPIDMLYGYGESIANGAYAMAHKTGFTPPRIARVALVSGFSEVRVMEGICFDIWALLLTPDTSREALVPLFTDSMFAPLLKGPTVAAPETTTIDPPPAQA